MGEARQRIHCSNGLAEILGLAKCRGSVFDQVPYFRLQCRKQHTNTRDTLERFKFRRLLAAFGNVLCHLISTRIADTALAA